MKLIIPAVAAASVLALGSWAFATSAEANADGYEIVEQASSTVSAGTSGQAEAVCPSGKKAVGGGFALGSSPYAENMKVRDSRPYDNGSVSKWSVVVKNDNTISYTFAAYAVCVDEGV